MIVYRLSKYFFADDLSGRGAEQYGGRWNSKGFPVIYTAENRSLCTAEIAVHIPLGILPVDYSLVSIDIPDQIKILTFENSILPKNWKDIPPNVSSQIFGNAFLKKSEYLVMKVPSVIVQGEYNFLINPKHKDVNKISIKKIEPFSFDERLFMK